MNKDLLRKRMRIIPLVLATGLIVLSLITGYLYRQTENYLDENHRLIVINDSLLSVNIELRNALASKKTVFTTPGGSVRPNNHHQ